MMIVLLITGAYKITSFDISLRSFMSGLLLLGLLGLSLTPAIKKLNLRTGDFVYAAMIVAFDMAARVWHRS